VFSCDKFCQGRVIGIVNYVSTEKILSFVLLYCFPPEIIVNSDARFFPSCVLNDAPFLSSKEHQFHNVVDLYKLMLILKICDQMRCKAVECSYVALHVHCVIVI
jgi:hypothetical protein